MHIQLVSSPPGFRQALAKTRIYTNQRLLAVILN